MKIKTFVFILMLSVICVFTSYSQLNQEKTKDWRNIENALSIIPAGRGYCDQPYVVVLNNGSWLCVFTTNSGGEGTKGQHIVSCTSNDQGRTWSDLTNIEDPGTESASWAMPYLTKYGRVYVFYIYNGDKIHELNGKKNIREDMLGWYCYKYSENAGKTWSKRFRLDVPKTMVDYQNNWKGKVQIMWGIGKPVDVDDGVMFAFTKIKRYMLDNSEGWFFSCDNIHIEKDPGKLNWVMLPRSQNGLKNEALGPVNAEQNIFQMNNGAIYCVYRTVSGHPAEAYSQDKGKSWTQPEIPKYENGIEIKNPRACPRIWKCKNGKYLFWYHNNGAWDFRNRNPAWISGGIEREGKIIWSQPEILFYDVNKDVRLSYPDLIEQDDKYWITETNKEIARCHEIPVNFLNTLWSQFERDSVTHAGLLYEWSQNELLSGTTLNITNKNRTPDFKGFTLDFRLILSDLQPGQVILTSESNNKYLKLTTGEYGSIKILISDGKSSDSWISDPGIIKAYGEHCVSVSVDNGPGIIQFVIDGIVCNGRDFRQFGWGRYNVDMEDFYFEKIKVGTLNQGQLRPKGSLTNLRIYNRPLMNTEIIGNYRNFRNQKGF